MWFMRDSVVKRRIFVVIEDGLVLGEKFVEGLGIFRVVVWKYIREFKRFGYKIEVFYVGYFLREWFDVLYFWELLVKVYYLEEMSLMMDVVWKLVERDRKSVV